jgi:hypothetical protein
MATEKTAWKGGRANPARDESTDKRRSSLLIAAGVLGIAVVAAMWMLPTTRAAATQVMVYKSPTCGCCNKWIAYLRDSGFQVRTQNIPDVGGVRASHGVPQKLASCHTAVVDGYVVEGHVPADDIGRLLNEQAAVVGLAVPGMPAGSPGMGGRANEPYDVLAFDGEGRSRVYATH